MIFDRIENIEKYKGIYSNLDMAIDFIINTDLSELSNGKNIVDSDKIYINIVDGQLIEESNGVYELHRDYLDIHIDIDGKEKILICDCSGAEEVEAYNSEGDYELLKGKKTGECKLDNNHFAICMTGEPHMPCIKLVDDVYSVRKAIVKVKVH